MGYDHVSMDLVKIAPISSYRPIARIINLCLCSGIVPDQLKIACVVSSFKSGSISFKFL